jgi:hypothetical protein
MIEYYFCTFLPSILSKSSAAAVLWVQEDGVVVLGV